MARDLPPIGANTRLLLAQPFLSETVRALQARGATLLQAPYPFGVQGTTAWLRAAAAAFDIPESKVADVIRAPSERATRALARYREQLGGKRVFFFPDSQLEIPLARFLYQECGVELVEVGTPYLDRLLVEAELPMLPGTITLSEGQDVDVQLDRCRAARPDLTVCGLGLANPLEAEGMRTKWSIELVFSPIHGYDQAADLAELFARPLERASRLMV
jgi:light-independent protochlorophyllide reductase subunit N